MYDDSGDRVWKLTGNETIMQINGVNAYSNVFFEKTLYASPYLVMNEHEYTKHYYIEGERVCSKVGGGFGLAHVPPTSPPLEFIAGDEFEVAQRLKNIVHTQIECSDYSGSWEIHETLESAYNMDNHFEEFQYYYHPDHLGSSSFITGIHGLAEQHLQYLPFGELWASQRNSSFDSRYKFSAKELDSESGYNYFGARYYDSDLSNWLSVDPMASNYSAMSPYMYCFGNPLAYVDLDGNDGVKIIKSNNKNPTIIVKANYYVQSKPLPGVTPDSRTSYDKIAIKTMNRKINNTLNNAHYKVTEGKYEGYNVEFDLSFFEGGESWRLDNLAKNDFYNNIPIGNTIRKGDEKTLKYFEKNPDCGGVTVFNKDIYMRSGKDSKRSQIHEVFHTLFFDRDGAEQGIGNYFPGVDTPNQEDINILINNSKLPAIHE